MGRKTTSYGLCTTSTTPAEILYGIELLIKSKPREGLLEAAEAMFTEDWQAASSGSRATQREFFLRLPLTGAQSEDLSATRMQIADIAKVPGAKLATRNVVTSRAAVLTWLTLGRFREAVREAKPFLDAMNTVEAVEIYDHRFFRVEHHQLSGVYVGGLKPALERIKALGNRSRTAGPGKGTSATILREPDPRFESEQQTWLQTWKPTMPTQEHGSPGKPGCT